MEFGHDGHAIRYVTAGHGKPLLFLHGLGGRLENWVHQMDAFARGHRVIAVDLPGHGRSGGREVSFLEYWRTLEALLDHLDLANVAICGLSKGARTGLMLAARRPERVNAVAVVNAFAHLDPADAHLRHALYDLLLERDGSIRWAEELLDRMGVRSHPAIVSGFLRSLADLDPAHIHARFLEMLAFDQREELAKVSCPVLIVRGTRDDFVPAYCAIDLAMALPSARRIELDLGLLPYLEDRTAFNTMLADFLGW